MSFPSVVTIASARGVDLSRLKDERVARDILAEAIHTDCEEAVSYLHRKVHEADAAGAPVTFAEDPNCSLGRALARLFASDVVRELVREHFLHGRRVVFYNCCGGIVPPKGGEASVSALTQIQFQAGPIAFADC